MFRMSDYPMTDNEIECAAAVKRQHEAEDQPMPALAAATLARAFGTWLREHGAGRWDAGRCRVVPGTRRVCIVPGDVGFGGVYCNAPIFEFSLTTGDRHYIQYVALTAEECVYADAPEVTV